MQETEVPERQFSGAQSIWGLAQSFASSGLTMYTAGTYDTNRHMRPTPTETADADASGSTNLEGLTVLPHGARFKKTWSPALLTGCLKHLIW